jgi:8-oxo-dGTP pyrophosphatase MutT (NUDIX family)
MAANVPESASVLRPTRGFRPTWGEAAVDRVRCVLRCRDKFLLADHGRRGKDEKWGLPGGRLLPREEPLVALRRELAEELRLQPSTIFEVGDWWHREENYRVYGSRIARAVRWFDERELAAVAWLEYDKVVALAAAGLLHKGFELEAIAEFRRRYP